MQIRWNLSYDGLKISSYWILGVSFAIAFLTSYKWGFFVGLALLIGLQFLWSWQRALHFRSYAESNGFTFLGHSPRFPLNLQGTALAEESGTISNCISGMRKNVEIAIFDFSFRRGRATVRQTIVCFRKQLGQASDCTSSGLVGVYHIERSGDWLIGYVPRRVVEVDELGDWCETLLNLVRLTGTNATEEGRAALNLHRLYTEIG
jgi:hypothetical protein